jgi:hypothetical protein
MAIGIGGFQPAASSFETSAFSSGNTAAPLASRSATVGGTSGVDQVSTKKRPDGEI